MSKLSLYDDDSYTSVPSLVVGEQGGSTASLRRGVLAGGQRLALTSSDQTVRPWDADIGGGGSHVSRV